MALKIKQYLENSWYRGASQDRQTGYAAQYQYGYGVNTRDMKNGVCLAGGSTDVTEKTYKFSYFTLNGYLYYTDTKGYIYNHEGTLVFNTGLTHSLTPHGIEFGGYLFIVGTGGIMKIDNTFSTSTNVTPTGWQGHGTCVLNYANTFLLVGDWNCVWRLDLTLGVVTSKKIREFENSYNVFGITQEGNYVKIYTSNGISTKIHYAKGTFDVEYTGLVQTVSHTGLSVNVGDITSDEGNDYVIFTIDSGEYKLAKIQGYNKTDIRWTQTIGGQKVFTSTNPNIAACDGVLFAAMGDGIRTFTEYNGWLWGGCCEFPMPADEYIDCMFRYKERLYVCVAKDGKFIERYYDLSFQPSKYQSNGYLISRVFDGGCGSIFKKNVQANITYNMPTDTNMELSYRYDRNSFGYDKSNFLSIKKLTDTNECYDIIFPTTPSTQTTSVLSLEDGDNILLENGNNILLEDLLVCPFNKTWNYLEYRVDLGTTDTTKTPILFEHSLLYEDRIRKYR